MDINLPTKAGHQSPIPSVFKLGDVIFHPDIGELHVGPSGKSIHLEKKVSQVLKCLAITPNEVVTREQLFDTVWPNITVSDDSLNRCIAMLRKTFKTHALALSIKTHPKVGFHLCVPASGTTIEPTSTNGALTNGYIHDEQNELTIEQPSQESKTDWLNIVLFSLLLITTLTLLAGFWFSQQPAKSETLSTQRVVILPFTADNTAMSNYTSLANNIRIKIAHTNQISTVSDEELSRYADLPSKVVGETFNARFVLKGNIASVQNRAVLTWQLIDAKNSDIILSSQLNVKLHEPDTNSQIIVTDIISAIGSRLYIDNPQQHVDYIVNAAKSLFHPSDSWQQHRPIITLVAQAIAEIDPESVIALKALSQFLTETMWPLGYQYLPYSSLAIRVLEKALALSPNDVELYLLLMKIHALQYNWQAAHDVVKLAETNEAISNFQREDLQAEFRLLTGQIGPSLVTYFQHKHQNFPLESRNLLSLFKLYLLSGDHLSAVKVKTNLIQTNYNWQTHGIGLGQISLKYSDIEEGKTLIWEAYQYLGVPDIYQQDIYSLYLNEPFDSYALTHLETALSNKEILPSVLLFIYGSLGLVDEYYDLAETLIDTYQFNLASMVNIHSEKLINAPQFPKLVNELGLNSYWLKVGYPSFCKKADENICTSK